MSDETQNKDESVDTRVDTGVSIFDSRSSYGGLPTGKPIAYQYDLIYQGDILLYVMANYHNTKFVTTTKSPNRIKELAYYSSSSLVEERSYNENLEVFDGLNNKADKAAKSAINALEEGDLLIIDRYEDVIEDLNGGAEAVQFTEDIIQHTKDKNNLCFLTFKTGNNLSKLKEIVVGQLPGLMEMEYNEVGTQRKQILRTHRIRGFNTGKKTLADFDTTHQVEIQSGTLKENSDTQHNL